MCAATLAPTVITISGSTFHTLLIILPMIYIFMIIVSCGILSLQYVNSMYFIVRFSFGSIGGGDWYGSPFTHKNSGLNLAMQ